jgi:hypothetical protein
LNNNPLPLKRFGMKEHTIFFVSLSSGRRCLDLGEFLGELDHEV